MRIPAVTAVIAAATALAGATAAPAAEKVVWNVSVFGPPRAYTAGIEEMAKYVGAKSGGNFTMKLHYGESVSPAKENLDGIKLGAFEMAALCTSYHPGKNPAVMVLDQPFLPMPTLEIQQAVSEKVYEHPAIKKEMQRWNAGYTFRGLLPQSEFMGNGKAPKTLADWKGMRVRALGGTGKAMEKLGAVPTTVPGPEVYTAMERGMFQAVAFPFSYSQGAYKIYEVSKWYTFNMAPGANHCPYVHNLAAYDALPAEYRKLIEEAVPLAYERLIAAYKEADDKWIPIFDKTGLERINYGDAQLGEFRTIGAQPVWDEWIAEVTAKGIPGKELLDLVMAEAKKAAGG